MHRVPAVLSFLPVIPSLPGPQSPWGYDSADDSDGAEDAALHAYYVNEFGQGHTGIVQDTPQGMHISLVDPAEALARLRAADQAARQAENERETAQLTLEAMPRTRALFDAAAIEACGRGWLRAADLAMADWDALSRVAALALCMALQAPEGPLPELFARSHLQAALRPLREACRGSAGDADILRHAVCCPSPPDADPQQGQPMPVQDPSSYKQGQPAPVLDQAALVQDPSSCKQGSPTPVQDQAIQAQAQAIQAQAQAICLRYRASTTALLQHVCQELS